MRHSFFSVLLAACGGAHLASAASIPTGLAPALPLSAFNTSNTKPLTPEEIQSPGTNTPNPEAKFSTLAAAATCTNPRVRMEWESYSTADRQNFVNALKCLMGRGASGQFSQAKNRYEDLVALHQNLMNNVHGNSKFLIWHRYYLWTFEDILRTECGLTAPFPWFDETKYAGRFSQSSIFSNEWFGGIALGGNCVTNGQFANLALNVGPGTSNTRHCLARNGDASQTAQCSAANVNGCNARNDYADMAACAEGAAHMYGHNGIGAVMADVYASPGDPLFWLHHAFIDRNYRIWQNANSARITYIDGTDRAGNPLTLDTVVSVNNLRPNVAIRDIINTLGTKLCYKYNY